MSRFPICFDFFPWCKYLLPFMSISWELMDADLLLEAALSARRCSFCHLMIFVCFGVVSFLFFLFVFFTIELNNFIVCNKAADLALKKMYNNQDTLVFLVTDLMYSSHSGVWTEAIVLQACLIVWGTLAGCITVGLLYQNDMPWHCTSPAVFL